MIKKSGLEFDEVHVSPLVRASETAQIITAEKGTPHIIAPELIERDFGKLSEQNKSLIKKYFGALKFEEMFHSSEGKPPQGESFEEMYVRVKEYYTLVLQPRSLSGQRVLVVAHKYIIEMFALIAADMEPSQYHDFKIPNSKPCSLDDLKSRAQNTSHSLNRFSEEIEARLTSLILIASVIGLGVKFLIGIPLPHSVFNWGTIFLLGINSWISLLRLETRTFMETPSSIKKFWKGTLLRAVLGLALLLVKIPLAQAVGAFLLLPPAMTAPTLSLMWGGDYFLCIQSTLLMSVLSPLLVVIAACLGGFSYTSGPIHLGLFLTMLLFSVLIPGIAAQAFRIKRPIQSGAVTTNWGWVGAASLIPLAFLTAYQFAPTMTELSDSRENFALSLSFAVGLFILIRILGWVATRWVNGDKKLKTDVYINHIVPNIFFWFALIPHDSSFVLVRILSLLMFFLSIDFEERRFVRSFPKLAGLAVTKKTFEIHGNIEHHLLRD